MNTKFELELVKIENPKELNLILGQSHFIKTVEDIHEMMVTSVPNASFGLAFCEASQDCLIRCSGTNDELIELARKNALSLRTGHAFILFMQDMFPINILPSLKQIPEICIIHCATANPVQVIIAKSEQGRGILGVIDGFESKSVESETDTQKRKDFLRLIGYKTR